MDESVHKTTITESNRARSPRPLPPGWRWVRLGDCLVDIQPGIACGDKSLTTGIPHLRMNNISTDGRIDLSLLWRVPVSPNDLERLRLRKGDVLFNNTNSVELVGKTALFTIEEGDYVFSNHLTRLRTQSDVLRSGWLAFYLRFLWGKRYFERVADRWIGQSAVRDDVLKSLTILLPPPGEQDRLLARLEAQMAEVQRLRAAAERQLEAARAMQAAILRQVFPYKEGEALPPGWRWVRLEEIAAELQYGFTAAAQDRPVGPKLLRITDIRDGRVDWDTVPYCICPSSVQHKYQLQNGDILFARTGSVGNSYLIANPPESAIFASYLIRVKTRSNVLPQYLYAYLQSSEYWRQIRAKVYGGVQPNMNASVLASISVPLLPVDEQRAIVARLEAQMAEVQRLRAAAERQLEAIHALPGALLNEVFGGFEPPVEGN